MKKCMLLASIAVAICSTQVAAVDLSSIVKDPTAKQKTVQPSSSVLAGLAAQQLGLSEESVNAGLGALLKVAKDHINVDDFGLISKALPDMNSYLETAPKSSTSSLSSMLGGSDNSGKKALSLGYLDSAFESIGIPKEQVPMLIGTLTGYLSQNGYSKEAELLKQGLSFL